MRLTRQSSYAIRTLIYCAVNGERLSRISDIAKAHSISELFLFKLIRPLVDGGLIETVRGRRGGIRLARPATEISLLDTVKLTEENFAMAECFEGGSDVHCPLAGACDLSGALHEALEAFFEVLDSYTIADLAQRRQALRLRLGLEELGVLTAH
jgi:Rrf2 family transcriptional regulator, iron-responsive regulator